MASLTQGSPYSYTNTSSGNTATQRPWWQDEASYNLGNAAMGLAGQSYNPFPGPTVAAPSAATQQAEQMAVGNVGSYQPYLQQAGALTAASGKAITPGQINSYMNPFMNQVVGGIESNLNTNLNQNVLPGVQDRFVSAGQSRSPQEMQATNNAVYQNQQAIGQAVGGVLNSGYQGALSAAENQQQQEGRAGAQLGTLGQLTQQLGQGDVGSVAAAGQTIDSNNQANLNAAQNQFNQQQQWPWQQLQLASGIINGLPVSTTGSTSGATVNQQGYTASPLAQLGGLASLGSGLGNLFGGSSGGYSYSNGGSDGMFARGGRVVRPRGGALTLARAA